MYLSHPKTKRYVVGQWSLFDAVAAINITFSETEFSVGTVSEPRLENSVTMHKWPMATLRWMI